MGRKTVTACVLTFVFSVAALPVLISSLVRNGNTALRSWHAGFNGTDGVLLQAKNQGCGPAALAMILAAHGIPATMDSLERELRITSTGTSMSRMKDVAESHMLRVGAWRFTLPHLRHIPLPALLFLRRGHFVVLDSVGSDDRAYIRDPAIGRLAVESTTLAALWEGETLVFAKSSPSICPRHAESPHGSLP